MKKIKILIMILMTLIFTLLLTIMIENVSFAADFSGKDSINSVFAANPESLLDRKTISLRFSDMKKSNQVYCLEYHQSMNSNDDLCEYKILQYIEITGGDVYAKMWDTERQTFYESSCSTRMNAILGEILSGVYGAGYGPSNGAYTDAQRALYYYFPIWVDEVGTGGELGISSRWYDEGHELVSNERGREIYLQLYDKFYNQNKYEYSYGTIRMYLLDNAKDTSWQRLMLVSVEGTPPPPPQEETPDYDGYIVIKGNVWEDGDANIKSSTINGIHDSSDTPIKGVKVRLKGGNFQGTVATETNDEGEYTLTVNYKDANTPYHLEQQYSVVHNALMNNGYIEFEYDGLVYTTVKVGEVNETITSKARENESVRKNYDEKNTMQPKNDLEGKVTARTEFKFKDYKLSKNIDQVRCNKWCTGISAGGDSVKYKYTNPEEDCSHLVEEGTTLTHSSDSNWNTVHLVKAGYDYEYYHKVPVYGDPLNPTRITGYTRGDRAARTEDRSSAYPSSGYYEVEVHDHSEDIYCTDVGKAHEISTYKITYVEYYNVDLGLFRREQPDIALRSDIDKVDVYMKNQHYTYYYKTKIEEKPEDNSENYFGKLKFQNKYSYTYRKPVNPADIAYINDGSNGAGEPLKIYVTYKVKLANQSNTLSVKVHQLVSHYDLEYTVNNNGWQENKPKDSDKFKTAVSPDLNIELKAEETKEVEVTYKISETAIKNLIKQDSTLSNVFEIYTYSTQYGSTTTYAEQRSGGRNGDYAGIDRDSTPRNAKPVVGLREIAWEESIRNEMVLDIPDEEQEDDSDVAPSFVIELAKNYKTIEGTVFEDTLVENARKNERYGNGKLDTDEVGVKNVRVELWDADKNEIATIYGIENPGTQDAKPISYEAVTYTDKGGNFSFGENSGKNPFGVVVNNYYIKYIYGNGEIKTEDGKNVATTINKNPINARNYKSTIVTENHIKDIMQGKEVDNSEKWHLIDGVDTTTTAVDDLRIRGNVDTNLIYDNFNAPNNMEANSKPFELQVEYTIDPFADIKADVNWDEDGGPFKNTCSTFDFGIIERPREELIIDKSITKIRITLANGQILIDGNPRTDKLDYTKVLGLKDIIKTSSQAENARDKLVAIEMDSEYIQGATLEVWYAIQIINNSEIDYDYNVSEEYYYYGDPVGKQIKNHVVTVADYIDPEFVVEKVEVTIKGTDTKVNRNKDWEIVDANTLCADGYISTITKEQLLAEKYIVLKTEYFKDMELPTADELKDNPEKFPPVELYASKLLANQEDSLTFENHTEIVEINGKVARTIDSVETTNKERIQNIKEYKPGDYVPNETREYDENKNKEIISSIEPIEKAGLHEQDDDMVKITITPPTGLGSNIMIYIITAVVALTITGIGIYFIKKKVL